MSFSFDSDKSGHAPVPATGPLAGTPYDFRNLFPQPVPRAKVSAADQRVLPSRRALFGMFRTKKAKP
ncbi:MAG TPA: hypothetical protein VEU96_11140 [Bryobacteraceae bacterium]|nr:hypothetical protein [Bryobacteraceae bacterium]